MKRITKEFTFSEYLVSELSDSDNVLYRKALEASHRAYASYSHFHVGAAALLENGEVILGCNQENAAYPVCRTGGIVQCRCRLSGCAGRGIGHHRLPGWPDQGANRSLWGLLPGDARNGATFQPSDADSVVWS